MTKMRVPLVSDPHNSNQAHKSLIIWELCFEIDPRLKAAKSFQTYFVLQSSQFPTPPLIIGGSLRSSFSPISAQVQPLVDLMKLNATQSQDRKHRYPHTLLLQEPENLPSTGIAPGIWMWEMNFRTEGSAGSKTRMQSIKIEICRCHV